MLFVASGKRSPMRQVPGRRKGKMKKREDGENEKEKNEK